MRSSSRRGQALVIAILALTVLTAAAIAIASAARLELRAARRGVDRLRLEAAARGGVSRGIARIEEARDDAASMLRLPLEHGEIRWVPLSGSGEETLQIAVQIVDASARLNLNSADADQLRKLADLDEDTAGAITAWRDEKNRDPDPAYERGLRPYEERRRPFDTVEELLLVRGIEPALFFGNPSIRETASREEPPLSELLSALSGENNTDEEGSPRLDVNSAGESELTSSAVRALQASRMEEQPEDRRGRARRSPEEASIQADVSAKVKRLIEQRTQRELSGQTYRALGDALRDAGFEPRQWGALMDVWTTDRRAFLPGRVNVNTAPALVLRALPGISAETAGEIVRKRREESGGLGWQDLLDLLGRQQQDSPDTGGEQPGNQQESGQTTEFQKHLCLRSSVYLVRCLAREGVSRVPEAASAVVYLPPSSSDPARIVQWRRPDRYPGWTAWYRIPQEQEGI